MTSTNPTIPRRQRHFIVSNSEHLSRPPYANRIAYWRKRVPGPYGRFLTQKELAKLADISSDQLGRYERGERKPSLEVLLALWAALGIPPQTLYPELAEEAARQVARRRRKLGGRQEVPR